MPTRPTSRRPVSKRSATRLARPPKYRKRNTRSLESVPLLGYLRAEGAWDWRKMASLAVMSLVSLILWQCLASPAFLVGPAIVSGNKGLATSEVIEATKRLQGRNIFLVDPQEAWQSVKSLPGVKDVSVRLELPNRLLIEISDEEPQLIWEVRGVQYWIGRDGETIKAGSAPTRSLLITNPDPKAAPLKQGQRVDTRAISTVQQLQQLLPNQVRSYEWSPFGGITVVSNEGWRAGIGWDDNLEAKVEMIRATIRLVTERREALKAVDVHTPTRTTYVTTTLTADLKPAGR